MIILPLHGICPARVFRATAFLILLFSCVLVEGQELAQPSHNELLRDPSPNFFDIQSAFEAYESGLDETKGRGIKPFKRWEWRELPRISSDGSLRDEQARWTAERLYSTSNNPEDIGFWTSVGPFTKPDPLYHGLGGSGVGRVNKVRISVSNPGVQYASSPGGGLFKREGTSDWTWMSTSGMPVIGTSDLVEGPDGSLYLATGDYDSNYVRSVGILKSTDGGASWTHVWHPTTLNNLLISRMEGRQLADGSFVILVATNLGIWRSSDEGLTWNHVVNTGNFSDLEFSSGGTNIALAAEWGGGVYRTTDAGLTWTAVGLPLEFSGGGRLAIASSPSAPGLIYALSESGGGFHAFAKTTDAGLTWTTMGTSSTMPNLLHGSLEGLGSGGQGWYDLAMAVHPTNPNDVVVGGINVWRTFDGGATWEMDAFQYGEFDESTPPGVHADIHGLTYDDAGNLFVASDGGIHLSEDLGATYVDISSGLFNSMPYHIDVAQDATHSFIQGTQDNGSSCIVNDEWTFMWGGDGMEVYLENESDFFDGSEYSLVSSQKGWLGRVTRTYSEVMGMSVYDYELTGIAGVGGSGVNEASEWDTPVCVNPENGAEFFLGKSGLFHTTDAGDNWTALGNLGFPVKEMSVNWLNPSVILVSNYWGDQCKRSVDGGLTFSDVSIPTPSSGGAIMGFEWDPNNPDRVFVCWQSLTEQVWMSEDGGQTYQDISTGLPSVGVNGLHFRKGSDNELYAATDLGVYRWNGSAFEDFNLNLPNVEVIDLDIHEESGVLYAGTWGLGIWRAQLAPVYDLALEITFDNWPHEISWDIQDESGNILASGGGYDENFIATTEIFPVDLGGYEGCFSLNVYDTYGDGLINGGGYALMMNGEVLVQNDSFSSYDANHDFCIASGCTDALACNFDLSANLEDETCVFPEVHYDCDGVCLNDVDSDGICDEFEISGCTDADACNYNPDATDAAACGYDFMVLEFVPDSYPEDISWTLTMPDGSVESGELTQSSGPTTVMYCYVDGCYSLEIFDSYGDGLCCDSGIGSYALTSPYGTVLASGGEFSSDTPPAIDLTTFCSLPYGCMNPVALNFDPGALEDDGSCELEGCMDVAACNYDATANVLGACIFADGPCEFCVDGEAVVEDADTDGVCDADEMTGCTDPAACNFDANPTTDTSNDLCVYPSICESCSGATDGTGIPIFDDADGDGICDAEDGCSDLQACNYASDANSTCAYLDECGDCGGLGIPDGLCNCDDVLGCTYANSCNFNALATVDDGSCDFSCFGCTDLDADNYDASATIDDGSCVYSETPVWGCTYAEALNYSSAATLDDGSCLFPATEEYCEGDLDADGLVGVNDLLLLLGNFGDFCEVNAWTCGDLVTYDFYDYQTVQIGDQCWFQENLRTEHYANGNAIPGGLNDDEWVATNLGAMSIYGEGSDSEAENLENFGRLYNWYAVDDERGLCPVGWHVPSDSEWMTLEMFLGMSEEEANNSGFRGTDQGTQMKASSADVPGWNGTNSSGFFGLPGSQRVNLGGFLFSIFGRAYWWSSTSASTTGAWDRVVDGDYEDVNRAATNKGNGNSVRCVFNE